MELRLVFCLKCLRICETTAFDTARIYIYRVRVNTFNLIVFDILTRVESIVVSTLKGSTFSSRIASTIVYECSWSPNACSGGAQAGFTGGTRVLRKNRGTGKSK